MQLNTADGNVVSSSRQDSRNCSDRHHNELQRMQRISVNKSFKRLGLLSLIQIQLLHINVSSLPLTWRNALDSDITLTNSWIMFRVKSYILKSVKNRIHYEVDPMLLNSQPQFAIHNQMDNDNYTYLQVFTLYLV